MSVTKTVVFATSVSAAPQSRSTAAMFASACLACASTPPATMPPAGTRPTWPASTIQSPARTAGEYGPAAGGALGVATGSTVIAYLLGAGNVVGRPSAFHVAAATAAKTASVDRARGGAGSSRMETVTGG